MSFVLSRRLVGDHDHPGLEHVASGFAHGMLTFTSYLELGAFLLAPHSLILAGDAFGFASRR
jgi:hypothetical protein